MKFFRIPALLISLYLEEPISRSLPILFCMIILRYYSFPSYAQNVCRGIDFVSICLFLIFSYTVGRQHLQEEFAEQVGVWNFIKFCVHLPTPYVHRLSIIVLQITINRLVFFYKPLLRNIESYEIKRHRDTLNCLQKIYEMGHGWQNLGVTQ